MDLINYIAAAAFVIAVIAVIYKNVRDSDTRAGEIVRSAGGRVAEIGRGVRKRLQ